jgi:hypothetical protein
MVTAPYEFLNKAILTSLLLLFIVIFFILGSVLGRPTFIPFPAIAANIIFGEFGDEVLLGGQRVVPSKLSKAGFVFTDTDIQETMQKILKSK